MFRYTCENNQRSLLIINLGSCCWTFRAMGKAHGHGPWARPMGPAHGQGPWARPMGRKSGLSMQAFCWCYGIVRGIGMVAVLAKEMSVHPGRLFLKHLVPSNGHICLQSKVFSGPVGVPVIPALADRSEGIFVYFQHYFQICLQYADWF